MVSFARGPGNPLFAARAVMQTRYLQQIETELHADAPHGAVVRRDQGRHRLREVGKMFFEGVNEYTANPATQ